MKKSEKNRPAHSAIFFPGAYRVDSLFGARKPQNLPRIDHATTQYYRTPTAGFQIASRRKEIKGRLSARLGSSRGVGANALFSRCSYE
jgi:hypothetical protein